MSCEHKTIVLSNATGEKLPTGGYAVDFIVRCGECAEVFFRTTEYEKEIINLSKH